MIGWRSGVTLRDGETKSALIPSVKAGAAGETNLRAIIFFFSHQIGSRSDLALIELISPAASAQKLAAAQIISLPQEEYWSFSFSTRTLIKSHL